MIGNNEEFVEDLNNVWIDPKIEGRSTVRYLYERFPQFQIALTELNNTHPDFILYPGYIKLKKCDMFSEQVLVQLYSDHRYTMLIAARLSEDHTRMITSLFRSPTIRFPLCFNTEFLYEFPRDLSGLVPRER